MVRKMTGGESKMAYLVYARVVLVNVVLVLIVNARRVHRARKAAYPG